MQKNKSIETVKAAIEKKLIFPEARFGVSFIDLQTGITMDIKGNENFHAASTMKTPVMIELYRQAEAGFFNLNDSMLVKNSFRSIVDESAYSLDSADDSEPELYRAIGEKQTLAALAYKMIILSSNIATNLLIEKVGPDSIMQTLKAIGATNLKVLRGVEDQKAFDKGLNNSVTANDLALLYKLMADEKLISAKASQEMIKILLDQRFNEIIPAKLPAGVKVAHKTGSITGVQHDSGIVYLPDGRKYVLVLLSKFKQEDEKKVIEAMADVSKMLYDYMVEHP